MPDRVAGGPGHGRRAAQRVGVLHPRVLGTAVACHDRAVRQQRPHVCGRLGLARLGPQLLQVRGEHGVGAEQALDAHRRRHVGGDEQLAQVGDRQHEHAEHAVGAVDQGEPFLLAQRDGFDARLAQHLTRVAQIAGRVADRPLSHQRERAMGERRQVTGAAERAVLAHDRRDARRQDRRVGGGGHRPNSRPAARQGRQAQQHHRPDDLSLHLRARAGGVAADQAALQCNPPVRRDVPRGERPEAGGDAVVRPHVAGERLDDLATGGDLSERLAGELHRRVVPGDGDDVVEGRCIDRNDDGLRQAHTLH